MNYTDAKKEFEHYLDGYDRNNDKVRLKIIHTYGVVHDMEDICRRMNLSLEDTELAKIIALLHDIGRAEQYRSGIPHDEAGAQIAEQILRELSFDPSEIQEITSAIREHRNAARSDTLSSLIYDADKASRNCFSCPAEKECYWSAEKKNLTITY